MTLEEKIKKDLSDERLTEFFEKEILHCKIPEGFAGEYFFNKYVKNTLKKHLINSKIQNYISFGFMGVLKGLEISFFTISLTSSMIFFYKYSINERFPTEEFTYFSIGCTAGICSITSGAYIAISEKLSNNLKKKYEKKYLN